MSSSSSTSYIGETKMARQARGGAAARKVEAAVEGAKVEEGQSVDLAQTAAGQDAGAAKQDISKVDLSECGSNMSQMIRVLHSKGFTRSEIAKELSGRLEKNVRYQYVRNILVQNPMPKSDAVKEDARTNG